MMLAPVVACGSEPVSPLPFDAPSPPGPSATPEMSPSPQVSAQRATGRPSPTTSRQPSACLGAVVYTLKADEELALVRSLCLAVGAILRIEGTGPGTVSPTPRDKTSCHYEGGVVECRFLSPGNVTVSIERDEQTFPIQVVIR
jgi:hypothetical protein